VFPGRKPHSRPKGAGTQRPPNFLGPPTWAHRVRETTAIFHRVIKLDVRKTFTQSTTNADARFVCGS